ncbi:filamin-A-like [Rhopilema esculentum]|uniref:filamin-A-like n=1 Tax=Rhopilema esculentum TaxID=499914 RepID=UPI0031CDFEF3
MDSSHFTPNSSTHDLGSSLSSLSGNEETSIYGQPNPFRVKAKGKGLESGHTSQPCFFTLDARKAGYGDFDILIKGPSQADILYHDQDDDTLYTVEYHVALPGDYFIEIKYDNRHIPGSPFAAKIVKMNGSVDTNKDDATKQGSKDGKAQTKPTMNGEVLSSEEQKLSGSPDKVYGAIASFQGYVTSPSGDIFTAALVRKSDGTFSVQFPRNETGTYLVNIVNPVTGKCISGCPFKVKVEAQSEEEPKVYGSGLEFCQVEETGMFTVKGTENFSFSELSVAFEGIFLSNVKVFKNFYDSADFLYVPNKAGKYKIHINYRGQRLTGSPYRLVVRNRKRSQEVYGNTEQGSVNLLIWLGKDFGNKVNSEITTPSGSLLPHSFSNRGNNLVEVRFCPKENGPHIVKIGGNLDDEVAEEFVIATQTAAIELSQPFPELNSASVLQTQVGKPGKVIVDLPTGIPKYLTIQFSGPGKIESKRVEGSNGQIIVHFKARIPGSYFVSVNYDGIPVRGSPYQILIFDENGNPMKNTENDVEFCSCYGKGLQEAKAGQISNFVVDACNAGSGSLMVGFDDPDVVATEVVSKHMGNCVYEVHYCIEKQGLYDLTVMWGGKHVPGSPFSVHVT